LKNDGQEFSSQFEQLYHITGKEDNWCEDVMGSRCSLN